MINEKIFYEFAISKIENPIKGISIEKNGNNSYLIKGEDFVAKTEMEIYIENSHEENGTWHKEYYAQDVTNEYYPDKNNIGLKEILERIIFI